MRGAGQKMYEQAVKIEEVRKCTELQMRREVEGNDRPGLIHELERQGFEGAERLDARSFKDWEDREHEPRAANRDLLCVYFKVPTIALLGLGDSWEAAFYWSYLTDAEWRYEVDRRKSLQIMGAAGAVGAAGLLFPGHRLVALGQMMDGTGRVGEGDLAAARQTATDIAAAYVATPDGVARRAARAHALTLLGLLGRASMRDEIRRGLTGVASDAASLHGYGHLGAGRLAEAGVWFKEAVKLARQAGDRPREAYALGSSALTSARALEPDHAAAVAAFEAAAGFQRFLSPGGRAWVFANLADQRAALKDDLASGRLLGQARAAAARVSLEERGWGWWSIHGQFGGWDGVRPEVFTAARSLQLGRPAEALQLLDGALDGTILPVRRALLHEDLTRACVALGYPDRACASAHAVLDEVKTHELGAFPPKIRKIRVTFPPRWSLLAPVIELDERLRAVA